MKRFSQGSAPTFLLYGIQGVYNYGCEAIVRGTFRILREQWPNCRVRYASKRPADDARILADSGVQVVDGGPSGEGAVARKARSLLRRVGCRYRMPANLCKLVQESDVVLSIGGDLYTIPPVSRNRQPFFRPLIDFGEQILAMGKKFVIWGASIGPFEKWLNARRVLRHHLSQVSLITAREPLTVRYLRTLGLHDNVRLVADPAFVMAPAEAVPKLYSRPTSKPIIGVNLSPLSLRHLFGNAPLALYQASQAKMVMSLLDNLDVQVLLVPHVVCPWHPADDDYRWLAGIKEMCDDRYDDRLVLLPPFLGARATKAIIWRCAVVIAARMHCAIAAVSVGVPTIFLSYSSKSLGMAEYVYGNSEWVIPIRETTPTALLEKTEQVLADQEAIRRHLGARLKDFQAQALSAGKALNSLDPDADRAQETQVCFR